MKTIMYGKYNYFVVVYYTNAKGEFCSYTEKWRSAVNAKEMRDIYERNIGKMWQLSADVLGVIDSVFTFKGKQCCFTK